MKSKFHQCKATQNPYKVYTEGDYQRALQECEIKVEGYSESDYKHLLSILQVDKRKNKHMGLRLVASYAPLNLLAGDRWEPSDAVPDWALLFQEGFRPSSVMFIRPTKQTLLKHRNPLFEVVEGGIPGVCALDMMHMFPLGVIGHYVCLVFWQLMKHNLFAKTFTTRSKEEVAIANLEYINLELQMYYKSYQRESGKKASQMDLKVECFGTMAKPIMHAKAGETMDLLRFLCKFLPRYTDFPRHKVWLKGVEELHSLWEAMETYPLELSQENIEFQHLDYSCLYVLFGFIVK
eukprot:6460304-Amphidinium_carterae.1